VLTKLSAMPLLCGLHAGAVMGFRPNSLAMRLVSAAMYAPPFGEHHDGDGCEHDRQPHHG